MNPPPYPFSPEAVDAVGHRSLTGFLQALHDVPWGQPPAWPSPERTPGLLERLERSRAELERAVLREGINDTLLSAQGAVAHPSSLALLPLVLNPTEWSLIEAGVAQRAALLQSLMQDLYGPQDLLRLGLLPGSLMLRHPGYMRPVKSLRPPRGLWLYAVAMDLARTPDGQWCVVSHSCQALSGLGRILRNRRLVARQFPEAYRELGVQDIAARYKVLLSSFESAAREVALGAMPRLALLTSGPSSEAYGDHAELARHLGLPLVEGSELTVRQQHLFLKTVNGWDPVHGLLNGLDDDACDPLELRADSELGVPGLLQALRAGHLAIANVPGCGVLETPGLHGFLPTLSRHVLQQELLLPSLDSWWCGEPAALEDVRKRWPSLAVSPTFPGAKRRQNSKAWGVPTPSLSAGSAGQAVEAKGAFFIDEANPARPPGFDDLSADPDAYTAREPLRPSAVPVWDDGKLTAQPCLLRVYAIANSQGGWQVLPGGRTQAVHAGSSNPPKDNSAPTLDIWVRARTVSSTYAGTPQRHHPSSEDH